MNMSPEPRKRSPKNVPYFKGSNGRLQIVTTYQGEKYFLSIGVPDTPRNRVLSENIRLQMEIDITSGNFDASLIKYKERTALGNKKIKKGSEKITSVICLWEEFVKFQEKIVSATTLEVRYKLVYGWITKFPTAHITDAVQHRDFLLTQTTPLVSRTVLQALSTACRWGERSGLIESNPYKGLGSDIRLNSESEDEDIDPFDQKEMEAVINAFRNPELVGFRSSAKHYADFVEFRFLTGCRTSEAVGLLWKDINKDCTKITFQRAVVRTGRGFVKKGLKTQERRVFPCSDRLRKLLLTMKEQPHSPEDYVFQTPKSRRHIDVNVFNAEFWRGRHKKDGQWTHKGLITVLAERNEIDHYRRFYNTRHTFITLCMQKGIDVPTIAKWVGNSPETIYKHYAGWDKDATAPEF